MSAASKYVLKLSDQDVIRAFTTVANKFTGHGVTLSFSDTLGMLPPDLLETYEKSRGFGLRKATISTEICEWGWLRLRVEHNDSNSATHDKLTFTWNGSVDRLFAAELESALDVALSRPLATVGSKGAQPLAAHSEVLQALESAVAGVLVDATKHRQLLEASYLSKEEALTARFDEIREREIDRLQQEKDRAEKSLEARAVALDEKSHGLDLLQKSLMIGTILM